MDVLQSNVGAGAEGAFLPEDVADINAAFAVVDAEFEGEQLLANLQKVSDEVGSLAVDQEHEEAPLTSEILACKGDDTKNSCGKSKYRGCK